MFAFLLGVGAGLSLVFSGKRVLQEQCPPELEAELRLLRDEVAGLRQYIKEPEPPAGLLAAASDDLQFHNISRERFTSLVGKLKPFGLDIASDAGTVSRNGFKVSWSYDAAAETLSLQLGETPPFLPRRLAIAKIQEIVTSL